jgi:hypothetical protein
MNWKNIPIPNRMADLERDSRGYPIPYIIYRDQSGRAHFQINDDARRTKCINLGLCAICGGLLNDDVWLVGGALSAFHKHGAYIDTPTHHECNTYAMQVCPYLAAPSYAKRLDDKTLSKVDKEEGRVFIDNTMLPDRPDFFVCVKPTHIVLTGNGYLSPVRPYEALEVWKQGVLLPNPEAWKTLHDFFEQTNDPLVHFR